MIAQPQRVEQGAGGEVRLGRLLVGRLASWHIDISPTTGQPTLIGQGRFFRYYQGAVGARVIARVTPPPSPNYIGRPKAPPPQPFTVEGTLAELKAGSITISRGTIVRG